MISDINLQVSDNQDLYTASGAIPATNLIYLETASDVAQGNALRFDVQITEAFVGGTSLIIALGIVNPADAFVGSVGGSSLKYLIQTTPILAADLKIDRHIQIGLPPMSAAYDEGHGDGESFVTVNGLVGYSKIPAGSGLSVIYVTAGNFTAGRVTTKLITGGMATAPFLYRGETN